jgi:hypothetical protein
MSFDLTNKNIKDTFQNLLQRTGSDNRLYDLLGNEIGDLRISGSLIAQQYIVSSSVTNITTQQLSGSTQFGDSSDDTHLFTGNITASQNISSSGTIIGSNLSGTNTGDQSLVHLAVTGSDVTFNHITASGNISASATSTGSFGVLELPDNGEIVLGNGGDLKIFHRPGTFSRIQEGGDGPLQFSSNRYKFMAADNSSFMIDATSGGAVDLYHNNNKKLETTTDGVIVTGDISGSGTGSFSDGRFTGKVGIGTTSPLTPLHIKSAGESTGGIRFQNTHDTVNMFFVGDDNDEGFQITYVGTGGAEIELQADGDLLLNASNGDNVAIGNTSPTAKLDITGDLKVSSHITASGDISASGNISANSASFNYITASHIDTDSDTISIGGEAMNKTLIQNLKRGHSSTVLSPVGRIQKTTDVFVTGDVSASGDFFNSQVVQMTNSSSVINTFNTGSHQTCKYVLQVTSGSFIQSSEMLVVQSGSNAFNTEYAQIGTAVNLGSFSTTVSGNVVKLNFAGDFISCSVKFNRTLI